MLLTMVLCVCGLKRLGFVRSSKRLDGHYALGVEMYASTLRDGQLEKIGCCNLGSRIFTYAGRKQKISRLMATLKRGTRGQEATSQARKLVLVSMWEVATHDRSS